MEDEAKVRSSNSLLLKHAFDLSAGKMVEVLAGLVGSRLA
jgi:hypothetical protein